MVPEYVLGGCMCTTRIVLSHCVSFVNSTLFIQHVLFVNALLQYKCAISNAEPLPAPHTVQWSDAATIHARNVRPILLRGSSSYKGYKLVYRISEPSHWQVCRGQDVTLPACVRCVTGRLHGHFKVVNTTDVFSTYLYMPVICYLFAL